MTKVISFDLHAPFAVFKKPDINKSLYLTYNMLHRPALLGILGAIVGLEGFKKNGQFPEYYNKFINLRVGIEPLCSDKGIFPKTIITYNNAVGYASSEEGGMLQITEQMLYLREKRKLSGDNTETLEFPGFRCYLMLNTENEFEERLYDYIKTGKSEYIPYFGKNECAAWWNWWEGSTSVQEYQSFDKFNFSQDFTVTGLFIKEKPVKGNVTKSNSRFSGGITDKDFLFFERLPVGYNPELFQYEMAEFVYMSMKLEKDYSIPDLFTLVSADGNEKIVQLFNYETPLPEDENT
jgi:CRISPR-associated protein Cas5h